eukprot:SAG11_NODE_25894_length_352_cov_1.328063_1_plen_32_part_10
MRTAQLQVRLRSWYAYGRTAAMGMATVTDAGP